MLNLLSQKGKKSKMLSIIAMSEKHKLPTGVKLKLHKYREL